MKTSNIFENKRLSMNDKWSNPTHSANKEQSEFFKSVCLYYDNKFCEPQFGKKHVEFEHGNAPFSCDYCFTKFHFKHLKEYHEAVHHLPAGPKLV